MSLNSIWLDSYKKKTLFEYRHTGEMTRDSGDQDSDATAES